MVEQIWLEHEIFPFKGKMAKNMEAKYYYIPCEKLQIGNGQNWSDDSPTCRDMHWRAGAHQ